MRRFLTLAAGILAAGLTVLPEDASAQWRGGWRGGGVGYRGAWGGGYRGAWGGAGAVQPGGATDGEEAGAAGTVATAGAG
jgi:hypothetical protein